MTECRLELERDGVVITRGQGSVSDDRMSGSVLNCTGDRNSGWPPSAERHGGHGPMRRPCPISNATHPIHPINRAAPSSHARRSVRTSASAPFVCHRAQRSSRLRSSEAFATGSPTAFLVRVVMPTATGNSHQFQVNPGLGATPVIESPATEEQQHHHDDEQSVRVHVLSYI